jgi:Zn-dependent protease with chaperone function
MLEQGDAVYFDGQSNRKRKVRIQLGSALDLIENEQIAITWPYADVRRVDSAPGVFRVMSISAPPLARLEIHDEMLKQAIESHCPSINEGKPEASQTLRIVLYSAAALVSLAGLLIYGVPVLADRLAMVVPHSVERRMGEAVDKQVSFMFGGKACAGVAGNAALARLVDRLQSAAGLNVAVVAVDVHALATALPNAFALPGGKVYVTNGLLQKARSADEVAGVIAHELGHLQHRDGLRKMIQAGGTAFLVGLMFGDVLGGGAVLFAARELLGESYSRDAERSADAFSIDVMHKLGRSTKPMGELLIRITGPQANRGLTLLASHPLTEERLATMTKADQPVTGPELLSAAEWQALQGICR